MTNIIFYGGVKTIGGNCVILESKDSRIMIDNGMCFSTEGDFYRNFLSARMGNGIRDLLDLNLIPRIAGIYGKEKLIDVCINDIDAQAQYALTSDLESYESYKERTGSSYIDALVLSHLHLDHVRNLNFMHPEIPVYCSQVTKDFLEIISDITGDDFLNYKFKVRNTNQKGFFPGAIKKDTNSKPRDFKIVDANKPIIISGFELTGYPTDHSVPGAMAFKIKTPDDKVVVYTGDIRFHGHDFERKGSEEFVRCVSSASVDALITEGTRKEDNIGKSEEEVYNEISNILKADKNLKEKMIFTSFPWKSISRFLTVYKIAKEIGRIMVIHPKLAYVLHHFKDNDSLGVKNIFQNKDLKIYKPRLRSMVYSQADYSTEKYYISFSKKWSEIEDKSQLFYSTKYGEDIFVKAYDIHDNPNKYILHLEFYGLAQLIDIQPPINSYFFNLKTDPYDPDGELEQEVLDNWISRYELDFKPGIHASGHASREEILNMINQINPKTLFPIHTQDPESFGTGNLEDRKDIGKVFTL